MALVFEAQKNIPDYYKTMYLDGYTPEEIMFARKRSMLENREDDDDEPIDFNITVKKS